jgi:hypothetical protein
VHRRTGVFSGAHVGVHLVVVPAAATAQRHGFKTQPDVDAEPVGGLHALQEGVELAERGVPAAFQR